MSSTPLSTLSPNGAFVSRGTTSTPENNTISDAAHIHSRHTVLFLVDQLKELGGGERILLQLASSVSRMGMQTLLVTFRSEMDPAVSQLGYKVISLPMNSCFSFGGVRTAWRLRNLMREERVTIVHTFFETSDIFGVIVARLAGVKSVVSSRRDMGILRRRRHYLLYRLLAPFYTSVLAVSECVREWHLTTDGLQRKQILTIHNGISVELFSRPADVYSVRAFLHLSPGKKLVTTITNINVWKGLQTFLSAAALISVEHPDAEFCIAGEWTDKDLVAELHCQAQKLGIASIVHLPGRIDHIAALLQGSDIFALLSRSEGFPNVVLEAMAAGTPVVATAVGGTPEAIVDGVSGLLVPYGDAQTAAKKISSLLSDRTLAAALAKAAHERVVRDFSIEQMVRRHIELYQTLPSK